MWREISFHIRVESRFLLNEIVIYFMFGACLRVSEIIGLTWSDVDMKNREIHVGGQLMYYECGKKIRRIYFSKDLS